MEGPSASLLPSFFPKSSTGAPHLRTTNAAVAFSDRIPHIGPPDRPLHLLRLDPAVQPPAPAPSSPPTPPPSPPASQPIPAIHRSARSGAPPSDQPTKSRRSSSSSTPVPIALSDHPVVGSLIVGIRRRPSPPVFITVESPSTSIPISGRIFNDRQRPSDTAVRHHPRAVHLRCFPCY